MHRSGDPPVPAGLRLSAAREATGSGQRLIAAGRSAAPASVTNIAILVMKAIVVG
jgi:hypothetical protein